MVQPSFNFSTGQMRPFRGPANFCSKQRNPFYFGPIANLRGVLSRPFDQWFPRPSVNCIPPIFRQLTPLHLFSPVVTPRIPNQLVHSRQISVRPQYNLHLRPKRKRSFTRSRFYRRSSRGRFEPKTTLNPSDPLNLQDLMKETERRRVEGLSPLRGDSRMNTPALSVAGSESPMNSAGSTFLKNSETSNLNPRLRGFIRKLRGTKRYSVNCRKRTFIPSSGNYVDYYERRGTTDRIPFLMPEWFVGKDVADYGCHNGTLTFSLLERFPDVKKVDAFDCDAELIANAKSMQRERLRWDTGSRVHYDKINFQVSNWIDGTLIPEEPEYDTIMAFSVTKWIHLNYGDAGLMRFLRRAFNLLKPGGHLILEPQPKSSYRKTRFTTNQRSIYQSLKIDPSNLEPLLVDLGFSYFDTIKAPSPNEPFKRKIILCSKSYGATPASIRNDFRSEFQNWEDGFSPISLGGREPPPVCYYPQTPIYNLGTPVSLSDSPASSNRQIGISSSVIGASPMPIASPCQSVNCEPDSTTAS